MCKNLYAALAATLLLLVGVDAHAKIEINVKVNSKQCYMVGSNKCVKLPDPPPTYPPTEEPAPGCYPCVGTCSNGPGGGKVCAGEPGEPTGSTAALLASASTAGMACVAVQDGEDQTGVCWSPVAVLSWICADGGCESSDGGRWVEDPTDFCAGGDCLSAESTEGLPDVTDLDSLEEATRELVEDLWSDGDPDPTEKRYCTKGPQPVCWACAGKLIPPGLACAVNTVWGTCGASCTFDGGCVTGCRPPM